MAKITCILLFFWLGFNPKQDIRDKLMNFEWKLFSIKTDDDNFPYTRRVQQIHFIKFSELGFSGYFGCNELQGTCEYKNDSIKFPLSGGTLMYCKDPIKLEERLFEFLFRRKAKFQILNDTLILSTGRSNVFKFYK